MLSFSKIALVFGTLWFASPIFGGVVHSLKERQSEYHWVDTWTSMPQLVEPDNLPPAPFKTSSAVFNDATVRQTLHMSIGGDRIRFQISNTFGTSDLPITAASVANPAGGKAGVNGIDASPIVGLTFNGAASITIPRGTVAYSDPVDFAIKPQTNIAVTLYLAKGQSGNSITGHPGSRTTIWMQAGNRVNATTVPGTSVKHWYFLSGVEVWAPKETSSFIILGDSITDGRGSSDDGNNRWPDLVLAKMQKSSLTNIGVNNQAAGGNRVLADGLGPSLISRYKRDAITQAGVKYVMIFEGVNDIGTAGTDSGTQTNIGNQLISAFTQIAADAKKAGIAVFAATITPFSGSGQSYSNPTREATRQKVNTWIKTSGTFDAVVDFDQILRDPSTPSQLASKYNGGDYLHPNVAGYQALADAFPLDIFTKARSNWSDVNLPFAMMVHVSREGLSGELDITQYKSATLRYETCASLNN
ncbi:SGNH hydrolase-type esterase domain-containing protein [Bisporella sp. PMI_857]|nr:SGNH hydrolase-type esterase domain-containing protein [Bisporella sp. PMI_857]